jgi:hypothetical protein
MSSNSSRSGSAVQLNYQPLLLTCGVEIEHVLARARSAIYYQWMMEWFLATGEDTSRLIEWKDKEITSAWPAGEQLISLLAYNDLECEDASEDQYWSDGHFAKVEYPRWSIIGDESIMSLRNTTDAEIADQFKKKVPSNNREKDWELDEYYIFEGVELVSRSLAAPAADGSHDGEMDEVKRYCDVLLKEDSARWLAPGDYSPPHEAFTTTTCGGHIHIGLPNNEALPTPMLQHLAYLLLRYEPLISSLHHHSRTPYPETAAGKYCQSNRVAFQEDAHLGCSRSVMKWDKVRRRVFEKDIEIGKLSWLMGQRVFDTEEVAQKWLESLLEDWDTDLEDGKTTCDKDTCTSKTSDVKKPNRWPRGAKYKLSKWNNLPRCDCEGPRTIEFRQPAGTLSSKDITENVRLYTALLREAERRMHVDLNLDQPIGTCVEELDVDEETAMDLPTFLSMLDFHDSTKTYWERRARDLDRQRWEENRLPVCLKDWEKCSECAKHRDNAFTEMLLNRCFIAELAFDEFDINRYRPEEELEHDDGSFGVRMPADFEPNF